MIIKEDLVKKVKGDRVHQIRVGKTHRFIDITIVSIENRFFVRRYKFGNKSWYEAFIDNPEGQMKIGDTIVDVQGRIPKDLEKVNPLVNKAYRNLLGFIYPLMILTFNTKRHENSTLELIPIDKNK